MAEPNAGGDSQRSEAYAMEILYHTHGARGVTTEMRIKYWSSHWKKCDFITVLPDAGKVGVSVTRALVGGSCYDPDDIDLYMARLIRKKLYGLVVSRAGVSEENAFNGALLFIWSPDRVTTRVLQRLFRQMSADLTDGVHLVIAETDEQALWTDFRGGGSERVVVFT
jgi:hypothetical protein